jgi:hypothetical protein
MLKGLIIVQTAFDDLEGTLIIVQTAFDDLEGTLHCTNNMC